MKTIFVAAICLYAMLFVCCICDGQNYQCLQAGVRHYFINANGYARGIRIDSVRTTGDTIIYYPFHTPRGPYGSITTSLDSNGGSWLGKRVLQKPDGTFIFDRYWNDSVIVKTRANVGDSWVMYKDTSRLYYTATISGADTMTISSSLDSVKYITINAHDSVGIVTSDSLNGMVLTLSKNNGFIAVCDLYMFPYHRPGAPYYQDADYFLDECVLNDPCGVPCAQNTIFKLVDFINPNEQQLYSWNMGDTFQCLHIFNSSPLGYTPINYENTITETVVGKSVSGHITYMTMAGDVFACGVPLDSCDVICNSGTYAYSDQVYPVADTFLMPEENIVSSFPYVLHYFPMDTSYCIQRPAYIVDKPAENYKQTHYKTGIGKTGFYMDINNYSYEMNYLTYVNVNGTSCGAPSNVHNVTSPSAELTLSPNPAHTMLNIRSTNEPISEITITNVLGQIFYNMPMSQSGSAQIDVSRFPAGMYLVRVNGRWVKKMEKE